MIPVRVMKMNSHLPHKVYYTVEESIHKDPIMRHKVTFFMNNMVIHVLIVVLIQLIQISSPIIDARLATLLVF